MTSIIADSHLIAALGSLAEPVEIHDPSGKLLGHFTPACIDERSLYEQARKQFDPGELNRRNTTNGPGIATADLLAKLNALETR
ncbi:MAG: hypothetical protein DCC68_17315 [Planctomycetota bacterium]|nr:MAG: hypothetical protein DCC68_17315 [Planctomycetota bacterium]